MVPNVLPEDLNHWYWSGGGAAAVTESVTLAPGSTVTSWSPLMETVPTGQGCDSLIAARLGRFCPSTVVKFPVAYTTPAFRLRPLMAPVTTGFHGATAPLTG